MLTNKAKSLFQVAASLVVAYSGAAGMFELMTLSRAVSRPGLLVLVSLVCSGEAVRLHVC